jgi:hypothetical protein
MSLPGEAMLKLRQRVAAEIKTAFASSHAANRAVLWQNQSTKPRGRP